MHKLSPLARMLLDRALYYGPTITMSILISDAVATGNTRTDAARELCGMARRGLVRIDDMQVRITDAGYAKLTRPVTPDSAPATLTA